MPRKIHGDVNAGASLVELLQEISEYRGTGMGLDYDKIISSHKGSITCKSAVGEEATFIVSLSEKPAG